MSEQAIHDILRHYEEDARTATWKVQGNTVILHKALERIAARARIEFADPVILRAEKDEAVMIVKGTMGDRSVWSIGEALVGVNYRVSGKQAAYVYAMSEKRAVDRVILKLIGLHGLLYSEEEAEDFKAGKPGPADPTKLQEIDEALPSITIASRPGPQVPANLEVDEAAMREPGSITISSGKQKSAYQARKDGDWEAVCGALDQLLSEGGFARLVSWPVNNHQWIASGPWLEHVCEHWRSLLADYIGNECETVPHVRKLMEEHIVTLKTLPEPWQSTAREAFAEAIANITKMRAGS